MQAIVNILIMVVILGVLISLHEAGHLGMAKLFKVYCFEYSIGFGPQFLHVKREGGETTFSLRAFPIGGFVSMYGEEGAVPEGVEEPPKERSLENKKLYQKILIMSAGVVVNYLLGLILLFVAVSCFPVYYQGYSFAYTSPSGYNVSSAYVIVDAGEDSQVRSYFASNPTLAEKDPNDYVVYLGPGYQPANSAVYRVFDGDVVVTIGAKETHYAAIYAPDSLTKTRDLLKDITLYPLKEVDGGFKETSAAYKEVGVPYEIDLNSDKSLLLKNLNPGEAKMSIDLTLLPKSEGSRGIAAKDFASSWENRLVINFQNITNDAKGWTPLGYETQVVAHHNDWNEAWAEWGERVPWANLAIIKGLASLFTPSGLKNVSGIVGMTAEVGTVMAMGGASMIFLYAGLISINLAFFNLLPFPGLDGWQILVSIVEGVSRKKIPAKAKGIASFVGLGLLVLLMVFVTIKDVMGLF